MFCLLKENKIKYDLYLRKSEIHLVRCQFKNSFVVDFRACAITQHENLSFIGYIT